MASSISIRCHYDVLGIERTADEITVKKAHRKLAIRFHPDKFRGTEEEAMVAAETFRLVQEAYECLSDSQERAWYDEHRESILAGIKPGENTGNNAPSFVVEISGLYHHPSAFSNSFSDNTGGFYQIYRDLFEKIDQGELKGWVAQGNIDEHHVSRPSFGTSISDWKEVNSFYKSWESFQSCLNFAWVDEYDIREAPNRRCKRAMEDENNKHRRKARKGRNDEVLSLVHFLKRRDPRVKQHQKDIENKKIEKKKQAKLDSERKKQEVAAAREAWKQEQHIFMAEMEAKDLDAGRIRLADLEDDDYEYSVGKKSKKRGKKGKKKRGDYEEIDEPLSKLPEDYLKDNENTTTKDDDETSNNNDNVNIPVDTSETEIETNDAVQAQTVEESNEIESFEENDFDEESEDSEEPDIWRCECCRKDFKSENQMENHLKSKKHKEAEKKYEKKLKQAAMISAEDDIFDLMDNI